MASTLSFGSAFGANSKTTNVSTAGTLFGPTVGASTAGGLFGASTTTNSTAAGTLFGSQTTNSGSLFGNTQSKSLFGGTTTTQPALGSFSFAQPTNIATAPNASASVANTSTMGGTQANATTVENLYTAVAAVSQVHIYGDERDQVIAKLNQLQAIYGVGKGFFSGNPPQAATFDKNGPFFKFKAIAYNNIPKSKDSDGLVGIALQHKAADVSNQRQNFVDALWKILGGQANLSVQVDEVQSVTDDSCEITLHVVERSEATGGSRTIGAAECVAFLRQASIASQLSQQLGVTGVYGKCSFEAQRVAEYLAAPPAGIDVTEWRRAIVDNPDPEKLIPWPVRGVDALLDRRRTQHAHADRQAQYADSLSEQISSLENRASTAEARATSAHLRQQALSHRLLKVLCTNVRRERAGCALDQTEEQLHGRLEALQAALGGPHQLKGRLDELLSVVRADPRLLSHSSNDTAAASGDMLTDQDRKEVARYLARCQTTLESIVQMVKDDKAKLNAMAKRVLDLRE